MAEKDIVTKDYIKHAEVFADAFNVNSGNEANLMHLLLSVSEKTAVRLVEQLPSAELVKLLSGNNNGLVLFAHHYHILGDEVKNILAARISTDDFRHIFIKGTFISGFVFLLSVAEDSLKKSLCCLLKDNVIDRLIQSTIENNYSIGTLHLSLRELKKESEETLSVFEDAIGVKGYERLLESQGTIPILVRIICHSSFKMQKELSEMLVGNLEMVKSLLERTTEEQKSIGTLNEYIKILSSENDSCLQILENSIGTDGYFEMFSKCNVNSITILRILACSSLSDSLVDKIYANIDIWNESKKYISEVSCTIMKDFNSDLLYAQRKCRKKFFDFMKGVVRPEELLGWIRQGAALEEAIFIIRSLPFGMAKSISDIWLQNYGEIIEGIRWVEQNRDQKKTFKPEVVNRAIMGFKNYNQHFFDLIYKEYHRPLQT